MAPIVRSLPSYVKDSQHALQIFRDFNFLGEGKLIFTMDITSLNTVISNGEGPGADPGEVKRVNFHPPPFFWAPLFLFFLIP